MDFDNKLEKVNTDKIIPDDESLLILGKALLKKIFETTSTQSKFFFGNIENFQTLFNECEKNNKEFIDNNFPPNENSLVNGLYKENLYNDYNNKKWLKIKWLRVKNFNQEPFIFSKLIDPNEINQGSLNNCYLLSAFVALSEYPQRVKKLFLTEHVNDYGIYGIRLCRNGIWSEIIIDDYFPCDIKRGIPCFSTSTNGSLWVQILEKCFAKAYGSFYKVEHGNLKHALRELTGAPTIKLETSNDSLLILLKEACEKKWIITASAASIESSKEPSNDGLIHMHAYSILDIHEFSIESETFNNINSFSNYGNYNMQFLLKVRNPWCKNDWTGDMTDFNNIWKESFKLSNSKNCFYMNYNDFKHYFSTVHICKYYDNYKYRFIKLNQKFNSYCLVKMKILSETPFNLCYTFISLVLPDNKKILNIENNSSKFKNEYPTSRFIVCKLINKTDCTSLGSNTLDNNIKSISWKDNHYLLEYLCGKMGQDYEIFDEKQLEMGEYLIFLEVDWKHDLAFDFRKSFPLVLSTYSLNDIELTYLNNVDYPQILEKIYTSCAKKQNNYSAFTAEGAPNCIKYTNVTPEGYVYIYYENNEEDVTLIKEVKYTNFEGLKLMPPFGGTRYNVRINPGKSQIILIKQVEMICFNLIYSYQTSVNFEFSESKLLELTIMKGEKTHRKDTKLNIDLDIIVYTYKYSHGLCFYYENKTSDRKLEETLKIKSTGVEILEPHDSENIYIVLGPNEKRLIQLRAKKNNWSVKSSVSYKIESL